MMTVSSTRKRLLRKKSACNSRLSAPSLRHTRRDDRTKFAALSADASIQGCACQPPGSARAGSAARQLVEKRGHAPFYIPQLGGCCITLPEREVTAGRT